MCATLKSGGAGGTRYWGSGDKYSPTSFTNLFVTTVLHPDKELYLAVKRKELLIHAAAW